MPAKVEGGRSAKWKKRLPPLPPLSYESQSEIVSVSLYNSHCKIRNSNRDLRCRVTATADIGTMMIRSGLAAGVLAGCRWWLWQSGGEARQPLIQSSYRCIFSMAPTHGFTHYQAVVAWPKRECLRVFYESKAADDGLRQGD